MDATFFILAIVTITSGLAAISLRSLVHCALCFAGSLLGIAGIFLWLGAQFIGFAQVLVYVGAISILVVFAILLTRGAGNENGSRFFGSPVLGVSIAVLIGGVLLTCLALSDYTDIWRVTAHVSVRQIGEKLMTTHVLALEIIALMLTAALLGAVTLAMPERKKA